jgi:hypothetical protein
MTTDPECQEFQKRGERKREREREREREKETSYRCVCISICTLSQSLAPLFLLAYTSSLRSSRTHTQVAYGVLAEDHKVLVPQYSLHRAFIEP